MPSAKESSERCVAMEMKDEEPKGMQEKNDKGNIEESEKEIARYNEKDKESDATRKKKERRDNKASEDKDLTQQAFLADACCEHEIRKDGSMSVEKVHHWITAKKVLATEVWMRRMDR